MKFFVTILATFMLTMFFIPGEARSAVLTSVGTELNSNNTQQLPVHENENCPPFCDCFCCSVIIVDVETVVTRVALPSCSVLTQGYISSATKEISLPVWHPPQLL